MKQLLFPLLFLPCLALAQYPANAGQKITLGEQTTADGIIWRGVAGDTTLTAKSDTAAYFVLDTVNLNLYTYKASASGKKWTQLGADTASLNLVSRFAAKLNISDTASMLTPYLRKLDTINIKYVNTYGTQTVNGAKTFTDTIIVNKGIRFPATQSASTNANTLDDYEEGTWTPVYQGLGGSIGSTAYSIQRGRYTKIGRFCHASGEIYLTNKGSWSSGVVIEGLPFTTTSTESAFGFIILGFVDLDAGVKYCQFRGTGGANNRAYIDTILDNADRVILFTTAINNNSTFEFSFIYTVN